MSGDADALREVLAAHFIMWRDLNDLAGPSGEWFCSCDETFGFSDSVIDHQRNAVAAYVAAERDRAVAEALAKVKATAFPVALLAEKTRTQMREAGDLAASLLRHEDDQVKHVGHDLLHHLAAASRGFALHDKAMAAYRAALPAEPTTDGAS